MNEVRLIDADALKKKFDDYSKANPNISGIFELAKIIVDNAPTVNTFTTRDLEDAYIRGKNSKRPQGEWKETGYETGALGITYMRGKEE